MAIPTRVFKVAAIKYNQDPILFGVYLTKIKTNTKRNHEKENNKKEKPRREFI